MVRVFDLCYILIFYKRCYSNIWGWGG